jgi:D-hydroxyproline dehydrogenase subunit beta
VTTIVVGAGIVGACTAFELAQRGEPVILVDRAGVAAGTTGLGEGNVLAGDKREGPELDLTIAGLAVYDEIESLLGATAGIRRKGSLIVHPSERTWAGEPERLTRLLAAGVSAELLAPAEVRAVEPRLTGPLHGASRFADDLQCDPRSIARGLVERARRRGCELRTDTEVRAVAVAGGRAVGVRTAGGLIAGDAVVLAAGPWSGPLAAGAGLALPVEPRKGQLARLRLPEPDEQFLRHKIIDGDYLLSVASADAGRQLSTVAETTLDGHVIVGSSRQRAGFDPAVDAELANDMRRRAARLIPSLAEAPLEDVWVGFRPWLPDGRPAIGGSRRVPGLVVGTGHEGAGVAHGPITGRLLAELICGEAPTVDLAAFDPDRFGAPSCAGSG